MKYLAVIAAVVLSFAVNVFGEEKSPQLKDQKDKASYSIGLNIGFTLKRQNLDLNADALMAGFKDSMSGRKPLLTEQGSQGYNDGVRKRYATETGSSRTKRAQPRVKNSSPKTKRRKA